MKRLTQLIFLGLALLPALLCAQPFNRSNQKAQIDALLPSNNAGGITAAQLRTVLKAMVDSGYFALDDGTPLLGTAIGNTLQAHSSALDTFASNGSAYYLNRANHSGTQAQSSITNLLSDLALKAALADLVASNASGVNTDGLLHWSQLIGVPAGFADGTDDGSGAGDVTLAGNNAFTGINSFTGSTRTPATAMAELVMDHSKAVNTKTVSADSSITYLATPSANNWSMLDLTNSDSVEHVITLPASPAAFDHNTQQVITSYKHAAGARELLNFYYDGTVMWVFGVPTPGYGPEVAVTRASTTDLGAASSINVGVTNTSTTITSFGTVAAGTYRQGRFLGAGTLTHNGTSLILPGTTNITTAANDRFGALSLGSGNWLVLWYQRADGTSLAGGGGSVSDTAYNESSWNGQTGTAPSQNAVRDTLEALASSINSGTPNGSGARLHWSQLTGVPAGIADGTDDGAGGGGDNITVNGSAAGDANFSDSTPAAATGTARVTWQKDSGTPNNISAAVDVADIAEAFRRRPYYFADFVGSQSTTSTFDPFVVAALASGTFATGTATANHPGVIKFTSSTTTNSGARCYLGDSSLLLGGGEEFTAVVNITTLTNGTFRIGFNDTTSSSDNADGCYIEVASTGIATGKTASNSSRNSTGTTYTVSTATWYRFRVVLNSGATSVSFYIYDESGTQLWTDTLSSTIPTGAGRFTGAGVVATNVGTTATDLVEIDYLALRWIDRALTR